MSRPADGQPLKYSEYLHVDRLLEHQQCRADPPAHDELQFIVVHQVYELWFRLVRHELDEVGRRLDAGSDADLHEAVHLLRRVKSIFDVLVPQIHVLESMRPVDFLAFRSHLNPASGFQSVQFREVECMLGLKDRTLAGYAADDPRYPALLERLEQPSLCDRLYACLARRGFEVSAPEGRDEDATRATMDTLRRLYSAPREHPLEYALCEAMVDLDEQLVLWRQHHVMMVERQIGAKPGTGQGTTGDLDGIRYLATTLSRRAVPDLWAVRTLLPD